MHNTRPIAFRNVQQRILQHLLWSNKCHMHTRQLAGLLAPMVTSAGLEQMGFKRDWRLHLCQRRTTAVMLITCNGSSTSIQRSWALATTCMHAQLCHLLHRALRKLQLYCTGNCIGDHPNDALRASACGHRHLDAMCHHLQAPMRRVMPTLQTAHQGTAAETACWPGAAHEFSTTSTAGVKEFTGLVGLPGYPAGRPAGERDINM